MECSNDNVLKTLETTADGRVIVKKKKVEPTVQAKPTFLMPDNFYVVFAYGESAYRALRTKRKPQKICI